MSNGFVVFVEHRNGKVRKASLESLSVARRLADEMGAAVDAVVVDGPGVAEAVKACGPDTLHLVTAQASGPSRDAVVEALEKAVAEAAPAFVLAGATAVGKDILPAVAARFGRSVLQDVTALKAAEGTLRAIRPIFAGKALETTRLTGAPSFVTLRPNVFPIESKAKEARTVTKDQAIDPRKLLSLIREVKETAGGKVELGEASIVVSGGRGIKDAENYKLIQELADVLSGAAGASRAVVDAGWVDHHHQVGQTGKTVSPQLYIAVGISGAIQHLAGMSSSKVIVAINKDPEAPIFKVANYGIVGDLFKVLPLLTSELRKALH